MKSTLSPARLSGLPLPHCWDFKFLDDPGCALYSAIAANKPPCLMSNYRTENRKGFILISMHERSLFIGQMQGGELHI